MVTGSNRKKNEKQLGTTKGVASIYTDGGRWTTAQGLEACLLAERPSRVLNVAEGHYIEAAAPSLGLPWALSPGLPQRATLPGVVAPS
jgi:hypothetical protein